MQGAKRGRAANKQKSPGAQRIRLDRFRSGHLQRVQGISRRLIDSLRRLPVRLAQALVRLPSRRSPRIADLVEQALPGVECHLARPCSCEYVPNWLELTLIGSARDLVRHGVVTAEMISSLPPSGVRRYDHGAFGTEASALVARTAGGGYRVNVRSFEDGAAAPIVWRFGIEASAEIRARSQRVLRLVVDNTRPAAS